MSTFRVVWVSKCGHEPWVPGLCPRFALYRCRSVDMNRGCGGYAVLPERSVPAGAGSVPAGAGSGLGQGWAELLPGPLRNRPRADRRVVRVSSSAASIEAANASSSRTRLAWIAASAAACFAARAVPAAAIVDRGETFGRRRERPALRHAARNMPRSNAPSRSRSAAIVSGGGTRRSRTRRRAPIARRTSQEMSSSHQYRP